MTTFYDVEGDYARQGATPAEIESIGRILEIERRCGIRSTYNVVGGFALDAPAVVAQIRDAGHEIASHSYDHSNLARLGKAQLVENLERTRRTFDELGITLLGHRSPQSAWDERVLGALVDAGFAWSAENGSEPHPYRIRRQNGKTLWRFPVAADDWQYESEGLAPARMLERFKKLVRDARGRRSHLAIGFHAWVEWVPDRMAVLEELFHWLVDDERIEIMPFGDVLRTAASVAPELAAAHG